MYQAAQKCSERGKQTLAAPTCQTPRKNIEHAWTWRDGEQDRSTEKKGQSGGINHDSLDEQPSLSFGQKREPISSKKWIRTRPPTCSRIFPNSRKKKSWRRWLPTSARRSPDCLSSAKIPLPAG